MHSGRDSQNGRKCGGPPNLWGTGVQFCWHPSPFPPVPPKNAFGVRVACPPTLSQPTWERQLPALPLGTPRPPGARPPIAAVCYLTTDTDIQREPPCDPHPESRHPRQGARCSTAAGSRAAERPGRAEVK